MNNMYLIPSNSKKSQLILGVFRLVDTYILGAGAILTLVLLFVLPGTTLIILVLKLAPLVICASLVLPIPNYHNTIVFIREIYSFYSNRRVYLWKGWCVRNEFK